MSDPTVQNLIAALRKDIPAMKAHLDLLPEMIERIEEIRREVRALIAEVNAAKSGSGDRSNPPPSH
jgi:hypothetical protein